MAWIEPFAEPCFSFTAWQISRYEKCLPHGIMSSDIIPAPIRVCPEGQTNSLANRVHPAEHSMLETWYNDSVSQNRYVKLTGTWNLCWRAKFLEGLTGSVCFLIRPFTSGGASPECSRRKWRQVLKAMEKST